MRYTPRQRLEIQGAFYYIIGYVVTFIIAVSFQYIANVGARAIVMNIIISSLNIALAALIYLRKKNKLKAEILPWILGFTTTLAPIGVRYNHAFIDGWTFAAQSINTTGILIAFIILLSFFYNPKLFRFFSIYAIFNWVLFIYLAYLNGAEFYWFSQVNGKPITSGLIILREVSLIISISIVFIIIYRNIYEVLKYDNTSTEQFNHIIRQSETQNKMTSVIKEKIDILFKKIDSQHSLLNNFNSNMEAQAARFSEMSATMQEISTSSDQMALESASQLVDGNVHVETVVDEFKDIREETKRNLDETYNGVQFVSARSVAANEHLMDVEKTVNAIKEQSSRIGQIVELIVDIADRINLLSLNASIEAARAGESGRGFAVVADEIGKLAFQTQESIKEINSVISVSAKSTVEGAAVIQKTAQMMREMVGQVNQNANRIKTLHESLSVEDKYTKIIIEQMKNNIALAKRVTTATEEQRTAFESTFTALEETLGTLDGMVIDAQDMAKISNEIYSGATDIITETNKITNTTLTDDDDDDTA